MHRCETVQLKIHLSNCKKELRLPPNKIYFIHITWYSIARYGLSWKLHSIAYSAQVPVIVSHISIVKVV